MSMCLLYIIVLSIFMFFFTQISEIRRYFPSEISVNVEKRYVFFCHEYGF